MHGSLDENPDFTNLPAALLQEVSRLQSEGCQVENWSATKPGKSSFHVLWLPTLKQAVIFEHEELKWLDANQIRDRLQSYLTT